MILLISLFTCHWLADYTHLSMPFMLSAKKFGKPLFPIWLHALVHALLMFCTILIAKGINQAFCGFLIQLFSHFLIDVLKGRMNKWFPKIQNPSNPFHWYVFGGDQLLHSIFILIIYSIV